MNYEGGYQSVVDDYCSVRGIADTATIDHILNSITDSAVAYKLVRNYDQLRVERNLK